MRLVPYVLAIDRSIGEKNGVPLWSREVVLAHEELVILDDLGPDVDIKAFIYGYLVEGEPRFRKDRFTHVAFVDDDIVDMITSPTYRSGRDSYDYIVYDVQLAFLVHHAKNRIRL